MKVSLHVACGFETGTVGITRSTCHVDDLAFGILNDARYGKSKQVFQLSGNVEAQGCLHQGLLALFCGH